MRNLILCITLLTCFGCQSATQKAYEEALAKERQLDESFADSQLNFRIACLNGNESDEAKCRDESNSLLDEYKRVIERLKFLRPHTPDKLKYLEFSDKMAILEKKMRQNTDDIDNAVRTKNLEALKAAMAAERANSKEQSFLSEQKAIYNPNPKKD